MNICVYGASSNLIDKSYIEKTEEFGKMMGKRGHTLVYGGGAEGLMGAVARGMTYSNAKIIGVAPKFFDVNGILYKKCDEFIYPETMRERKQIMEDKSDGFVMTPGGIGTFEEFFEILTLKQLARHAKPIAVLNINGYYDCMIELIENAITEKFMKPECVNLYEFFDDGEKLLDYMENYNTDDTDLRKMKNLF